MLYVIHEFGLVHPQIVKIVKLGRKLGIPVIEDCAHTVLSSINNKLVGTLGDYALYSLSKQLPIEKGGLLVGENLKRDKTFYDNNTAKFVEKQYYAFLPYLKCLSEKRKESFHTIRNSFKDLTVAFECDDTWAPYFVIFKHERYKELYQTLEGKIAEWGKTYVKNWFCVPTQPLMTADERKLLIDFLKTKL